MQKKNQELKKVWGKNAKTGKKSKTLNKGEVIRKHKNKYYNISNTEKAKKNKKRSQKKCIICKRF